MHQILMGLKPAGNIRNPCVFCLYHAQSKDKYTCVEWDHRDTFTVGQNSLEYEPLISHENIILPSLHLKLGLFKQFIKYLKNESAIAVVNELFPKTSEQKIRAGIFTGPQVDRVCNNEEFISLLTFPQIMVLNLF